MANDDDNTTALMDRLLRHERGARQQCQCRSNQENCMACDCGLAADEIARLRGALARLRDCDWTITPIDRMDAVRDIARAALNGEDTRPHD